MNAGRALLEAAWSPDWSIEVHREVRPDGSISSLRLTVRQCLDAVEADAVAGERERIREAVLAYGVVDVPIRRLLGILDGDA